MTPDPARSSGGAHEVRGAEETDERAVRELLAGLRQPRGLPPSLLSRIETSLECDPARAPGSPLLPLETGRRGSLRGRRVLTGLAAAVVLVGGALAVSLPPAGHGDGVASLGRDPVLTAGERASREASLPGRRLAVEAGGRRQAWAAAVGCRTIYHTVLVLRRDDPAMP